MIVTGDVGNKNDEVAAVMHMNTLPVNSNSTADSDSEDENERAMAMQQLQHKIQYDVSLSGPLSFVLEDVRRMESNAGSIEEVLGRYDNRNNKDMGNKRPSDSIPVNMPASLASSLLNRSGMCCLLTDSHDITVRRHQLKVLSEEFTDVDVLRFVEIFARGGMMAYNPISAQTSTRIKQLLIRLIDLERLYHENLMTCKRKDVVRAADIITGGADRADVDEMILRARNRGEELGVCVQRLLSLF
jgi:hypothetical protein